MSKQKVLWNQSGLVSVVGLVVIGIIIYLWLFGGLGFMLSALFIGLTGVLMFWYTMFGSRLDPTSVDYTPRKRKNHAHH